MEEGKKGSQEGVFQNSKEAFVVGAGKKRQELVGERSESS